MQDYWKIETRGEPIGAVQDFVRRIWDQTGLDGLIASSNGENRPRLLIDSEQLLEVNPFRPLMMENCARSIPSELAKHPQGRLGVLLRPCEMRALIEVSKRKAVELDRLVTICIDCLGTFPADEYAWRSQKIGASERLADDAIKFARQGGILAYRYRPACQICASPGAQSADINIHILGLPVRQLILVHTGGNRLPETLDMAVLADGLADAEPIQQHEHTLARQTERHHQTMERVIRALEDLLPKNVDTLIDQLENCGSCQRCMAVCPVCSAEFPRKNAEGHYPHQAIERWLVSCSGCGMCEQACGANLPLSVIFGSIREKLS